MSKADLSPEQRGTPEISPIYTEMKVYPLGFTSRTKSKLREAGFTSNEGNTGAINILELLTEEEIAVILAKVSRNPGGFLEIAMTVDEEGAAQFHGKWVVSVESYGHGSVAEHAVIHMAVEGISSLAGDELTDNRLVSPTEFSARFKGRQDVGYFTPEAVRNNPELSKKWHEVHQQLFEIHDELMEKGSEYINTEEAKAKEPGRRVKTKTVADQFKNLMPASRLTSIGVTVNAREAEHMIMKFLSSQYEEVQELGIRFKEQSLLVAPTLVKYADKNDYIVLTRKGIELMIEDQGLDEDDYPEIDRENKSVKLVSYDHEAEVKFVAAALYSGSRGKTYEQLLEMTKNMSPEELGSLFEILLGNLGKHDAPIRMLEFAGDYLIEVHGMTYGDWREWKRHRMEVYSAKDLDVGYGYMIPDLAHEMDSSENPRFHGTVDAINAIMEEVEELYNTVYEVDPKAAEYCVTRLQYRPAIVKMNLREAFHFIGLRTGPTAHPFIRELAWAFYDEVEKVHPLFAKHLNKRLTAEGRPDRSFQWTF